MITRTLELTEEMERRIQLASTAYHISSSTFIVAAISAALTCSAEEVPAIAKAFELTAVPDETQTVPV